MKKIILSMALLLAGYVTQAQVGIGTASPAASSQLEVTSTTKGFLPPRMTTAQRDAISSPATGLQIYNTDNKAIETFTGTTGEWLTVGQGKGAIATNTAIGVKTLYTNTSGIYNAANGYQALYSNTTGYDNVANGYQALYSNTTGYDNVANGYQALRANTSAWSNTANGSRSLIANTTGSNNTATGYTSLYTNTDGYDNSATGGAAMMYNTSGFRNTANGFQSLYNNTIGDYNTATGYQALYHNINNHNNTANGSQALLANTYGYQNTASGSLALDANTTGNRNTAHGYLALHANITGSNNTAIGYGADVASGALTNATAIGNGAIVAADNAIQLGNTSVTNVKTSGTITAGAVTYPKTDGTNGQVLTTNGSGTPSWSAVTATAYSGVLPVANGGTGVTTSTGTGNVVLSTSPTLQTPALGTPASGVMTNVTGTATGLTAGTATNIAGGSAGLLPYQSAANTTALLAAGTAGQVLTSGGAAAPTWTTPSSTGTHYLGEAYLGGVIFYLYTSSTGAQKGLVVSLTESTQNWGSSTASTTWLDATKTSDGVDNMSKMGSSLGYDARDWLVALGSGWYFPSIDELSLLWHNRFHVNTSSAGGLTLLSRSDAYWSSTENEYHKALGFTFFNGDIFDALKSDSKKIRGVKAF
ncbi:MAG: hypothetical protein NTW54_13700 [Bacteroidetes bacterium]|nr:hypothetical protein [Bacteroidota bacterium]